MFGIGLPEMIIIFAVALIVVGPDKLPGLARSLAKGMMEMKKTLNQVKDNLTQEGEVLDSVQQDLKKTADELRGKMIDADPSAWQLPSADPEKETKDTEIIDVQPIPAVPQDETHPAEGIPVAAPPEIIAPTSQQSSEVPQEAKLTTPLAKTHD